VTSASPDLFLAGVASPAEANADDEGEEEQDFEDVRVRVGHVHPFLFDGFYLLASDLRKAYAMPFSGRNRPFKLPSGTGAVQEPARAL